MSIVHKPARRRNPTAQGSGPSSPDASISTTTLVVAAEGELDASNALDLADHVERSLGSHTD